MKPTTLVRRLALAGLALSACCARLIAGHYQNFEVSVYIPVEVVRGFATPGALEEQWNAISQQAKIDKVYIETTRGRVTADADLIEKTKAFFVSHGVKIAGGMTFEAGGAAVIQSYCYTDPKDREFVKNITEFTAHHFDEIILDDFFFVTTKFESDIKAKGNQSWTEFRLKEMDDVAENLLVRPAKAINPHIKFVIKFPNWYEHFQGMGFDLDKEPKIFDGIYTGTETRDPVTTDQHLQQYESYQIVRFFDNIAPGRNGGGWVDTYGIRYIDRYAEQLWNTAFAKPHEITLFQWSDLVRPAMAGERPWQKEPTSYNYVEIESGLKKRGVKAVNWAGAAGASLEQADKVLGNLGNPVGVKSYKPYQSKGEDFLHNFLGNIGIPIDLYPQFPTDAQVVLLTEAAKYDPEIVQKIKGQLDAGKNVVITTGLLKAIQDKGSQDIVEATVTDQKAIVTGYGFNWGVKSGWGVDLQNGQHPILIPEVNFLTNDAWMEVRGETQGNGFPILLSDRYSKGILYVLTIPDDPRDLYELPREVLSAIKEVLLPNSAIHVNAEAHVALFAYDNDTFVVESYLDRETDARVSLEKGYTKLRNVLTGEIVPIQSEKIKGFDFPGFPPLPPREFGVVHLLPHSFAVLRAEK